MEGAKPAPIDPALLEPVMKPFPGARTLPAEAYTSAEVLGWEERHFFEASWVCAGRAVDLSNPGDQRALRVGREGILLVRGDDARLRGFYNVCRHRGHELLECGASRNQRGIKCPYHAWVYGLEGDLRAAPRFGDVPGFEKADYPLIEARVVRILGGAEEKVGHERILRRWNDRVWHHELRVVQGDHILDEVSHRRADGLP